MLELDQLKAHVIVAEMETRGAHAGETFSRTFQNQKGFESGC